MMDLHQLRSLRSVVRTGSITRAAEVEHVAQPSVSKQVRQLERELGVVLLHRVGRRVVPTEAGHALAACAGRILDDLDATVTALSGTEGATSQPLALCATETVFDNLLPPVLARLRNAFPAARISVEMLGTDDAVLRLLSDTIDLAIVALPVTDTRLDVHELFDEEVLAVVPNAHRWAGAPEVPLAEALQEPGLLFSMPGVGLRALIEAEATGLGIALHPGIELRSQRALLALAGLGGGFVFAPAIAARGVHGTTAVPTRPALRRQVGWARRRGRHLGPLAFALLEEVAAEARRLSMPA